MRGRLTVASALPAWKRWAGPGSLHPYDSHFGNLATIGSMLLSQTRHPGTLCHHISACRELRFWHPVEEKLFFTAWEGQKAALPECVSGWLVSCLSYNAGWLGECVMLTNRIFWLRERLSLHALIANWQRW